jgi:hypothetical protein
MGKIEVYPKEDPKNTKILLSNEDKKTYSKIYNTFRSYLSGMTMEREESGLKVCEVEEKYIK